jgi:histone demethylase JARID1
MVEEQSGYECITRKKRWSELARALKYNEMQTGRVLRNHYENLLYPYLLFESGVTSAASITKTNPIDLSPEDLIVINSEDESVTNSNSNSNTQLTNRTNTKNVNNNSNNNNNNNNKKKANAKNGKKKINDSENNTNIELINCLVCGRGDDEAFMLLCDECDDSYHTFCLYPPLKEVPKGDWRCPVCLTEICKATTDSYGFEQSQKEYTLAEFGKMANKFKADYFKKPCNEVSLEECEKEFWRLLSSNDKTVDVEYGADLHTIETGSGFPTRSKNGRYNSSTANSIDPYIDSPWNLNNLSTLEKSVLSQMNVPISGMKIPWAYVGMCFSCFCWHVEDHWSYSINYLHFGDAKTWYGVSGNDADKFESCMKQSAKELFDKSPDLLHHLVTIMDPAFFLKNKCPIYKVFQQAGEFVITFPRAYHAGFNQGFNFAEAVNFCPADWIPLGRAAIESYKLVKRHTVFSHDELVCKVATHKDQIDVNTACVIQEELRLMINTETRVRKQLYDRGIKNGNKCIFELMTDDERTCDYCKTTCFVSSVKCSCKSSSMVCLDHFEHLCTPSDTIKQVKSPRKGAAKTPVHQYTILYRYSLEELKDLYNRLKDRTCSYTEWCQKVRRLLNLTYFKDDDIEILSDSKIKPHLNEFLDLLNEAKNNKYPKYNVFIQDSLKLEYSLLIKLESECEKAENCSKMIQQFFKSYKSNNNNNNSNSAFTFDKIKLLVNEVKQLNCELNDSKTFLLIYSQLETFEQEIKQILSQFTYEMYEQYYKILKKKCTELEAFNFIEFKSDLSTELKLVFKQCEWLLKVNQIVHNNTEMLTLKLIQSLIDEFQEHNLLNMKNLNKKKSGFKLVEETFAHLVELQSLAQTWDEKAARCLQDSPSAKNIIKLDELESTLEKAKCIPVHLENVKKLERLVQQTKKSHSQAQQLLRDPKYPYLTDLVEVNRQIKIDRKTNQRIKSNSVEAIEIRIQLATDWLSRLSSLYLRQETLDLLNDDLSLDDDQNGGLNIPLLEALTPRLDLKSLSNKIQNFLGSPQQQTSIQQENPNLLSKRQRKSTQHQILAINLNSSQMEQVVSSLESISDLYKDRNFLSLSEKYKALQSKEIEFMKQVRKLNTERIVFLKNQIKNDLSNLTENEENKDIELLIKQQIYRCCSCNKSILHAIYTRNIQQCKLCNGIFHNSCKTANSKLNLCTSCERTKRPGLEKSIQLLAQFEQLEFRSFEANALQMSINRVLKWQEKYAKLIQNEPLIKSMLDLCKTYKVSDDDERSASILNDLSTIFDSMQIFNRVELCDMHMESLMLEIDLDEIKSLNKMFNLLNLLQLESDEFESLYSILNNKDEKIVAYLEERAKSVAAKSNSDETNTTVKREKKYITKKSQNIDGINKKIKLEPTNNSMNKKNSTTSNKNNQAKNSKLNTSGSDAGLNSTPKIKKKYQRKDENSNTKQKSRKRDHSEVDDEQEDDDAEREEITEERCAAAKCTQPTGKFEILRINLDKNVPD